MKTAIIYYSYDGNSALVARTLKEACEAAGDTAVVFEITLADGPDGGKKRGGFAKYAWGGSMVLLNKKPALAPLAIDFSAFDMFIVGAPVWAGRPAPPAAAFLETAPLAGKRTAFFCCHAGGNGKAPEKFRALLAGSEITGEIDLVNPAKNPATLKETITAWAASLRGA